MTLEIVRRTAKQHRVGQFSIHINGQDAEYTNDPVQHFPKFYMECIEDGMQPTEATEKAMFLAEERSKEVLDRVIDRIKKGSLFAGGVPLGMAGIDAKALPRSKRVRTSREQAVAAFLNRGKLSGLNEEQRAKRIKSRDNVGDHQEEWRARRKELIANRNQVLAKYELELPTVDEEYKDSIQRIIDNLKAEIAGLHIGIVNASHGFQYAYGQLMTKQVDMVNDDLRIVPLSTNTTVDTERDAKDAVSDFTTLDEFDGSGYSTGGLALDSQAVNIDDANDGAEFDAADEVVATLAAGTRAMQGILLISFITSLSASLPIFWLEFASNQTPGGGQFTFAFNAEGIVQASG